MLGSWRELRVYAHRCLSDHKEERNILNTAQVVIRDHFAHFKNIDSLRMHKSYSYWGITTVQGAEMS